MTATASPAEAVETTPAEPAPDAGHIAAIVADHSVYRAAYDLPWFGSIAFREGVAVPESHPMVESWLIEGALIGADGKPAKPKKV